MARQSTTAKISKRIALTVAQWIGHFRQGVMLRKGGQDIGIMAINESSHSHCTIRKTTLEAIATDLARATLLPLPILLRSIFDMSLQRGISLFDSAAFHINAKPIDQSSINRIDALAKNALRYAKGRVCMKN